MLYSVPMNLNIHPEVEQALQQNEPVVGLESTVLSHGLPWPENLAAGRNFEALVREGGAIPATVGIVDGTITIGLDDLTIERFCREQGIRKCSRRDLPVVTVAGQCGATTVAGTMAVLAMAGIRFFATGGIGGVHRGGETSLDFSADLREFERSPVCVVSAGVKSILDPARTLEVLETAGVTVVGYQTDEFPLFYTRTSGLSLPARADDAETAALIAQACFSMGSGMLLCNPVPREDELPATTVDQWISMAESEAAIQNIQGAALTPFLLKRLHEMSEGVTLKCNLALLEHNVRRATAIARAFAGLDARP